MLVFSLIVVSIGLFNTRAQFKPDPSCVDMVCSDQSVCRSVSECTIFLASKTCNLEPMCLDNPPESNHTEVCAIGDPILRQVNGILEEHYCAEDSPCPNGTYCNNRLMHSFPICCLSDPVESVRSGDCPIAPSNTNSTFCVDLCNHDGDCSPGEKCCLAGCSMACLPLIKVDRCKKVTCPPNTYCRRADMPFCISPGNCWAEGDCVPCPIKNCNLKCEHGEVLDSYGCTTCTCRFENHEQSKNPSRSSGTRLGFGWSLPGLEEKVKQQQWPFAFVLTWLLIDLLLC